MQETTGPITLAKARGRSPSRRWIGVVGILAPVLAFGQAWAKPSEEPTETNVDLDDDSDKIEWALFPNIETSTDRGVGGGLLVVLYRYGRGVLPYRDRVEAAAVVTNKLFQNHYIVWERLGLAAGRLRVRNKLGFRAVRDHNFCGIGNDVDCSDAEAEAGAADAGIAPTDPRYDAFVRDYFLIRYWRPYFDSELRYQPLPTWPDLKLAASLTASFNVPGTFGQRDPYPGSLYAQRFPGGEKELVTVAEVGVLTDDRDDEVHPSAGQMAGVYGRVGGALSGDSRAFAGLTLNAGRFDSLRSDLVWANRGVADVAVGGVPILELGRIGGFWNTEAFGGGIGRGVRLGRFIGRVKVVGQSELRWTSPQVYKSIRFLAYTFVDAGWIAASVKRVGGEPARVLLSGGGGPGIAWQRSFVARLDIGFSKYESWSPFFYLRLGHPF